MTYIKKLVMKGFKSFARETKMPFDRHTVVIVGPNGSGKSNITDALCFVLGRLSIKSIRAAKASHLIFSGNKHYKPSNNAFVEITFDNEEGTFALDNKEVVIKREVKKNGQGVYRINDQVKTRQEVLELLSQAGIDPHGFNIVLQGEIEKFVKMPGDERRKVIEEVSGISVYEMRKEKSLKELEKTNEKLKQVNAILRERTNYLKNLENEREQALKYKKLEQTVKKCKFSIIKRSLIEKEKQLKELMKNIEVKNKQVEKVDASINKLKEEISKLNSRIEEINKRVEKSAGVEQDSLASEISNLKQDIAGLTARKENYENQLLELDRRKQTLNDSVKTTEQEISEMSKQKGSSRKQELEKKKQELERHDDLKRKYFLLKSNLASFEEQLRDKKRSLDNSRSRGQILLDQIENLEQGVKIKESLQDHHKALVILKENLERDSKKLTENDALLLEKEKILAVERDKINEATKVKQGVEKLDICPLCKTKITKEHIDEVISHSDEGISKSKKIISDNEKVIEEAKSEIEKTKRDIGDYQNEINLREVSIVKIQSIEDKKRQLKQNSSEVKSFEEEIRSIEDKKRDMEKKISAGKISEEQYESLQLEINELQRSEERNLGMEITSKQRELDRIKLAIKQNFRDKEEIAQDLETLKQDLEEKEEVVEEKEEQAEQLKKKYQKMFEEKNKMQDGVRNLESDLMKRQNEKRVNESEINDINIKKAQINATRDTLNEDLQGFGEVEFINLAVEKLKQKLENSELVLSRIGNVNMRALEVYDDIKAEYDKIKEKVDQLDGEKEEIIKIIAQIDRKKRKTFLETLRSINELFTRNFSQLSDKGVVSIEPQDKKEIFNAGLDILVKVGQGKYFDVTSLSGGEQTLVALSLIFAIQDLNPYSFYIFDEIDAALDRRNSEKLAYLLKKHMKKGQYLIITHNDSIISESSNVLYGVSMQEGISKILSLEI